MNHETQSAFCANPECTLSLIHVPSNTTEWFTDEKMPLNPTDSSWKEPFEIKVTRHERKAWHHINGNSLYFCNTCSEKLRFTSPALGDVY